MNEAAQAECLFVLSRAPHSHSLARDCLDAIMTAGLLNQSVSLLFVGDGVYQLTERDWAGQIAALGDFSPLNYFVAAEALLERGLAPADCHLQARALDGRELSRLFADHSHILSF